MYSSSPPDQQVGRMGRRNHSNGSNGSNGNSVNDKYKNNHNNSNNKSRPEYVRGGSRDNVRRIVEKEGKIARNLVAYSVPPSETSQNVNKNKSKNKYRPSSTDRGQNQRGRNKAKKHTGNSINNNNKYDNKHSSDGYNENKDTNSKTLPESINEKKERESKSEQYKERVRKAIETGSENGSSITRSGSVSSFQSQKSLRARYWSYLFDNFHRSVDEIYATCENDESIIECQEVMLMLDVCKRDFEALIHRLKLFTQLEASEVRPQSLAWEVRKQMSPGKCHSPTMNSARSSSPAAARFLNLGQTASTKFSWADRVRGFSTKVSEKENNPTSIQSPNINKNSSSMPVLLNELPTTEEVIEEEANDESGWEIVGKGRTKSKSSSLVSSVSSSHSLTKASILEANKHKIDADKTLVERKLSNTERAVTESDLVKCCTPPVQFSSWSGVDTLSSYSLDTVRSSYCKISLGREFIGEQDEIDETSEYGIDKIDDATFGDNSIDYLYDLTENEIRLKEENERALATVIAEEKTLTKELEEEALKEDDQDDDMSSERDYTATDDGCETPKDVSEELPLDSSISLDEFGQVSSWDEICAQYDRDYDSCQKFSWGDRMEMSDSVRMPGRALEMHQKLSSPSRTKSRSESVKRSEERMARAERRRLRLLVEKCERLRDLSAKVQKVRELKHMLINEKERDMVEQMQRAESNRQSALQEKIKKAQEEELKVNEIAFINTLEAQNRKIEVQEKQQVSEARLQDLVEERQKRKEGKHAKEEAAQERRRALEHERLARLQEIKQKRGDQAAKWKKERDEREKAREEQAKEKQRERDMKVAARNEAMKEAAEELLKRIELKHIESTRRHEQRIEEVKEKSRAASSSRHATVEDTPSSIPYEKLKKCTICDIEIASDVYLISHLKGTKHRAAVKDVNKKITDAEIEAFSAKYIKEADSINTKKIKEQDERAKALKKRAKKIKARMTSKGKEYENMMLTNIKTAESQKQGKLQKCVKDINKILQAHSNGPWPASKVASLDKSLGEISRLLEDKNSNDQKIFCHLGGLTVLSRVLLLWDTSSVEKVAKNLVVPPKIIKHASESIEAACSTCNENCLYMIHSNKVSLLVDILAYRLKLFNETHAQQVAEQKAAETSEEEKAGCATTTGKEVTESVLQLLQQDDSVTLIIMKTLSNILKSFQPKWPPSSKKNDSNLLDLQQRLTDLVSYMTCTGILEQLINIYHNIQGPFEDFNVISVIDTIISLFQNLVFSIVRLELIFTKKKDDISLVSETMKKTEAFGLVALMYSLLHQGNSTRISPSPLPLADSTVALLTQAMKTLNILALIDLTTYQSTIAGEGTSLQYRSIISYLLRYTCIENHEELLHEVILSLGHFTALNDENQVFIQSGRAPLLLQQLCTLPFKYFSDPKLKNILFPTVISICYKNNENMLVVAQDVNPTLLAIYLEEMIKARDENIVTTVDEKDQRSLLELRFPSDNWEEAKNYFTESDNS